MSYDARYKFSMFCFGACYAAPNSILKLRRGPVPIIHMLGMMTSKFYNKDNYINELSRLDSYVLPPSFWNFDFQSQYKNEPLVLYKFYHIKTFSLYRILLVKCCTPFNKIYALSIIQVLYNLPQHTKFSRVILITKT
ncbi:unnamed protein product [Rhizophagus irregularis]|nr:unnamed protein product [Rhizophagus irregularis]